ncbi:MAG TPA: hypothetical protein VE173_09985, partial [Longimicrobiales bacterium]|nr:hypothetical protein [Longimicrobiales bacterium]
MGARLGMGEVGRRRSRGADPGRRRAGALGRAGVACALGLGGLPPAPAAAQVPFTGIGLGYPVPPVDGRAAGLGSSGVGLLGGSFTLRNPAELVVHDRSGIGVTLAPESVQLQGP